MPDVIDNLQVGEFIKSLLKERNMTQSDLAKELNISKSAVSQNLNGKSTFDIQNLMRIAEIFEISLDLLLNRKSDENRDVISEYERLVRKGYDEIVTVATERLNLSKTDLYGKTFVEYVIEYDKKEIFEYLIQNNIQLFEPYHSSAKEVQLIIISYMIQKGMNGFVSFVRDYVKFYGSFQIPFEHLEKDIIEGLDKYPDTNIVHQLFNLQITQEVPFLKYFKRIKKYNILTARDWSTVIGKYHAKTLLKYLLDETDVVKYIEHLIRSLILYGFFEGIKQVLKHLSTEEINQIQKKHSIAQDLIINVSEVNNRDLFNLVFSKGIYNNATLLVKYLISTNKPDLYQLLIQKYPEKLEFRIVAEHIAKLNNLELLSQISHHLKQDDLDYVFSVTAPDALECNLLLLKLGANMNTTYLNKDTTSKINIILSYLIRRGIGK